MPTDADRLVDIDVRIKLLPKQRREMVGRMLANPLRVLPSGRLVPKDAVLQKIIITENFGWWIWKHGSATYITKE